VFAGANLLTGADAERSALAHPGGLDARRVTARLSDVDFSPNGNLLAATDAGGIRLWNLTTPNTSVML
jgi:WD40 repeat protein